MRLFLKIFLGLFLAIVLLLGGLYAAISIPTKVDVTWSEKDVQSYMKKAHVDIAAKAGSGTDAKSLKPASLDDLLSDNFKTSGEIEVQDVITSAEATAMINTVTRSNGIFEDVKMKFRDDGTIEASCYLGKNLDELVKLAPQAKKYESLIRPFVGKPIYWRYSLERVSDKKFDAHTLDLKAGLVPVPLGPARSGLTEAGSFLNDMVQKIDGFTCKQLSIDSEGFHFKGTIPKKLEYINADEYIK